jgi:septal ring-binding cell division protein DamX
MNRFSFIAVCLVVSAPLLMTNVSHAAPKKGGGGSRPAASRPAASRPAPAHAKATPAHAGKVHPGTSHAGTNHAKAPAANTHANTAKANHSQSNAGKNGTQSNSGKNGGGQRNFPGRGFRGFTDSSWLPDFGAWAYYNPDDTIWYYWYEPSDMFLPVSYINDYRPVPPPAAQNNTSTAPVGLLSR